MSLDMDRLQRRAREINAQLKAEQERCEIEADLRWFDELEAREREQETPRPARTYTEQMDEEWWGDA